MSPLLLLLLLLRMLLTSAFACSALIDFCSTSVNSHNTLDM